MKSRKKEEVVDWYEIGLAACLLGGLMFFVLTFSLGLMVLIALIIHHV